MNNRKPNLRNVAEKLKQQRELEAERDKAYYHKITHDTSWTIFVTMTFFCLLLNIAISIDTIFDANKIEPVESYRFDRSLYSIGFQSVYINNDLFMPAFEDLAGFDASTFKVGKSLIFQDPKYFYFTQLDRHSGQTPIHKQHRVIRQQSVYVFYPWVQILLIIPFLTFLLKRQAPWFKFARLTCFVLIFPGSLIIFANLIF